MCLVKLTSQLAIMGVRSVILFLSPLLKLFVIARAVLVSKVYYITFPLRSDVLVPPSIPREPGRWWAYAAALPPDAKPVCQDVRIRGGLGIGRGRRWRP